MASELDSIVMKLSKLGDLRFFYDSRVVEGFQLLKFNGVINIAPVYRETTLEPVFYEVAYLHNSTISNNPKPYLYNVVRTEREVAPVEMIIFHLKTSRNKELELKLFRNNKDMDIIYDSLESYCIPASKLTEMTKIYAASVFDHLTHDGKIPRIGMI